MFHDSRTLADMAPYYEEVCAELKWDLDADLLATMKANNEKKVKELDDAIEDAEQNLGEIDVRDTVLAKAEYLASIGEKVGTLSCNACINTTLTLMSNAATAKDCSFIQIFVHEDSIRDVHVFFGTTAGLVHVS